MSMQIRFKIPHPTTSEDDRAIIDRLASIVCWQPQVTERTAGYRYQLDSTNDWWADKDPETGEFILAYRYGTKERMDPLEKIVLWLVAGA